MLIPPAEINYLSTSSKYALFCTEQSKTFIFKLLVI